MATVVASSTTPNTSPSKVGRMFVLKRDGRKEPVSISSLSFSRSFNRMRIYVDQIILPFPIFHLGVL